MGQDFWREFWNVTNGEEGASKVSSGKDTVGNDVDQWWLIMAALQVFNMATGFGLLEAGFVSRKNNINILMKNLFDSTLGGCTYWAYGYSFTFGQDEGTNGFIGVGKYFVNMDPDKKESGPTFTNFLWQLALAPTAATIVSGSIAERMDYNAYCLYSSFNIMASIIPAHWLWSRSGWLNKLGVQDVAGGGGIHLLGGTAAFIGMLATMMLIQTAWLLKPRLGRFESEFQTPMCRPSHVFIGFFLLWWGWFMFNAGSTIGVQGDNWHYPVIAAVMTLYGSLGGGIEAIIHSAMVNEGKMDVMIIVNGILAGMVAVTAGCAFFGAYESFFLGALGSFVANATPALLEKIEVDDVLGATCVHGFNGFIGMLAVGIFAKKDELGGYNNMEGLIYTGSFYFLGIQLMGSLMLMAWGGAVTYIILFIIDLFVPIRISKWKELLGSDFSEHDVHHPGAGISRAVSVLQHVPEFQSKIKTNTYHVGLNPAHEKYMAMLESELNWEDGKSISIFQSNPLRRSLMLTANRWLGKSNGQPLELESMDYARVDTPRPTTPFPRQKEGQGQGQLDNGDPEAIFTISYSSI